MTRFCIQRLESWLYRRKGRTALLRRNFDTALKFVNRALDLDATNPDNWRLRAGLFVARTEALPRDEVFYASAIADFDKAMTLQSDNFNVAYGYVAFLVYWDDFERAKAVLARYTGESKSRIASLFEGVSDRHQGEIHKRDPMTGNITRMVQIFKPTKKPTG